ncbi:MAG: class I SAM-dependent methyltransferase [Candidatus Paceibacteria bacterium]
MSYIEENKRVYNKIAEEFSQDRQELWGFLKTFKKYVQAGDTILDLGCGNGRLYQLFDKNQVDYIGVDQSEELVKIAKDRCEQARFLVADMLNLPLEDSSVDVVFCIATFHHLPDRESRLKALAEMKRTVKQGSKIIMTNWNTNSGWFKDKVESGDYKQDSEQQDHYIVPFKNENSEIIGERHYWGIDKQQIKELSQELDLEIITNRYINLEGDQVKKEEAMNLLTILNVG